jgi:DNA-binding response OmpR family regulator
MKILLVEDEAKLAEAIRKLLEREKYVVDVAESLAIARVSMLDGVYDLVLLDRMLPDGDGVSLIKHANKERQNTHFLILSALGDVDHRVEGLDLGADDYVTKPFEPEELLARIRACLRRPLPDTSEFIELANLRFERLTRNVSVSGVTTLLPRRELIILETLLQRAGQVVSRQVLESAMYGYDDEVQPNTLDSHVSRLRKNLSGLHANLVIHTIRGVGYMLREAN